MVYRLEKFKKAFTTYSDNYVIIGGAACDALLSSSNMHSRATNDINIIIVMERLISEFIDAFCFLSARKITQTKNGDGVTGNQHTKCIVSLSTMLLA